MAEKGRIDDELISEAFRNTKDVKGLTAQQIQGYLASEHSMDNVTDKDVRMAIHRGLRNNTLVPKGRGRFLWWSENGGKLTDAGCGDKPKPKPKPKPVCGPVKSKPKPKPIKRHPKKSGGCGKSKPKPKPKKHHSKKKSCGKPKPKPKKHHSKKKSCGKPKPKHRKKHHKAKKAGCGKAKAKRHAKAKAIKKKAKSGGALTCKEKKILVKFCARHPSVVRKEKLRKLGKDGKKGGGKKHGGRKHGGKKGCK